MLLSASAETSLLDRSRPEARPRPRSRSAGPGARFATSPNANDQPRTGRRARFPDARLFLLRACPSPQPRSRKTASCPIRPDLSTAPLSTEVTWNDPVPTHNLCTAVPRAPTDISRLTTSSPHLRPHPDRWRCAGRASTNSAWVQPPRQLGKQMWTAGDDCGRPLGTSELSTNRPTRPHKAPHGHAHPGDQRDQGKHASSPQPTTVTAATDFLSL